MTFAQHQTLFFCEFGVLQSHSIILQKLHSGSINGFQHTALYFCNVPDTNLSRSIIFPKLFLPFKLYSFILTPNEFFLYWIQIHSFLHIRIYSKQMYHHVFPQRTGKKPFRTPISLIFYCLGNLSGKKRALK